MKFHEALPALLEGKKIKLPLQDRNLILVFNEKENDIYEYSKYEEREIFMVGLDNYHILSEGWEIVE